MLIDLAHPSRPTYSLAIADFTRATVWDPIAETTMIMARPDAEPDLFAQYHRGAVESYARFGVADAMEDDLARFAADTALFWTLVDLDGEVVGGLRAKGPLRVPDDSHAVVEWAGRPGEQAVRAAIAERVPDGVLELKSAWLAKQSGGGRHRARMIARAGFHAMAVFDIGYCMATAADHVLEQWRSSGGVIASIPATPYPDERYRTKMLWWDRGNFVPHGDAEQVMTVLREMVHVRRAARASAVPSLALTA